MYYDNRGFMKKLFIFATVSFITAFSLFNTFVFAPFVDAQTAQSNCVVTRIGNPSTGELPAACQPTIACNNVTQINNISYTDPSNRKISVTVWNCDHAAPLVIFVPGQSRNADDPYSRYEKAIATAGFTVAGINFGTINDGHHYAEEADDVRFVISKLEQNTTVRISTGNGVGLVGHSDGGIVSLLEGYSGNNDQNIKAIISADGAMSGNESSSGPPLLLIHGDHDPIQDKSSSAQAFKQIKANLKYFA